ncbi:N2227-domain-containing protein, partial [Meira miltonrushii]
SSSEEDQDKERAHFEGVLRAFDTYLVYSLAANSARRKSLYALPRSHRLLFSSLGPTLPGPLLESEGSANEEHSIIAGGRGFKARLDEIDDRIRRNADFLSQIVSDSKGFLGEAEELSKGEARTDSTAGATTQKTTVEADQNESSGSGSSGKDRRGTSGSKSTTSSSKEAGKEKPVSSHDVDKVRSTLKQFVRDWSEEGASEREAAYDPILEALEKRFAHIPSAQRAQIRVLVPGAGLGRLAFEIAWQGFSCQGNEFSFFMLLASHFILNKTISTNQHVLYPFIHSSSNWRTATDMLRAIKIPDINPTDLPSHIDFSMVAGEFVEVYSKEQERGAWHSIATCFFIDTARNFARYLEVINHVLPIDGVWVNIGPLLWHFEGATN